MQPNQKLAIASFLSSFFSGLNIARIFHDDFHMKQQLSQWVVHPLIDWSQHVSPNTSNHALKKYGFSLDTICTHLYN